MFTPETAPGERPETPDKLSDPHTFCNCGKTGCPGIRTGNGGGMVIDAPREEVIEVGDRPGIPFSAEQARELRVWLEQHGF